MITTVWMDIDDTLLDFPACAAQSIQKAAQDFHLSLPEHYMDSFLEINDRLWVRIEKKELDLDGLRHIRFQKMFAAWHVQADPVAFEDTFRKYLNQAHEIVDQADVLLRYLSGKYVLAAAGNGMYRQQTHRLALAGLDKFFQAFFLSDRLGVSKPDLAFFQKGMDALGLRDPQQICMIGDSLQADMAPAMQLGMKTIWYNPRQKPCPKKKPDHIINTLSETMEIL